MSKFKKYLPVSNLWNDTAFDKHQGTNLMNCKFIFYLKLFHRYMYCREFERKITLIDILLSYTQIQ
jgi:hypothetical protein